jgi:1-acyl-sn-glycerol-3-phosphate acyltransferase
MSSPESERYNNLMYVNEKRQARDIFDNSIEKVFSKLAKADTGGTEVNIPKEGKLVVAFMPHTGFLEPVLIDKILSENGRTPPVWITKKESKDLPKILLSDRRFIYVDRKNPELSSLRAVNRVLSHPNGIVASALEGTRYSNPEDPEDVLTLGESRLGLMRFSYESQTPIMGVVVVGVDKKLPSLDKTVKEKGIGEALKLMAKGYISPAVVQMRFLPPYTDHLSEIKFGVNNKKSDFIEKHNEIFTDTLIKEIIKIDPEYPLGFYKDIFSPGK